MLTQAQPPNSRKPLSRSPNKHGSADIMLHKEFDERQKTFRDARQLFLDGTDSPGDVSLAGFLLQHCLKGGTQSIGSIGTLSDTEFMMLSALVDEGGNFVCLNTDNRAQSRQRLSDLTDRLEAEGFPAAILVSDLTLPSRWPNLLSALALGEVRVLGIDARWAPTDPQFWENLAKFVSSSDGVAYIRGALDFEHPDGSIGLLRTIPDDYGLEVIAATRASVWFAPAGANAQSIRNALHLCGLFKVKSGYVADEDLDKPLAVYSDDAAKAVDMRGKFPRTKYHIDHDLGSGVDFGPGWSSIEPDGCWTDGAEARISVTVQGAATNLKSIYVVGNPWMPPDGSEQIIEFSIGRDPSSWSELRFAREEIAGKHLDIPETDAATVTIVLNLRVARPGRPSDQGGEDSRLLGFKLRSLSLFT